MCQCLAISTSESVLVSWYPGKEPPVPIECVGGWVGHGVGLRANPKILKTLFVGVLQCSNPAHWRLGHPGMWPVQFGEHLVRKLLHSSPILEAGAKASSETSVSVYQSTLCHILGRAGFNFFLAAELMGLFRSDWAHTSAQDPWIQACVGSKLGKVIGHPHRLNALLSTYQMCRST
jgi:hypothetical protein